ncbi:hypothetical protein [Actinomadura sp. 3N407]|uniref:hypothetical protein n=1 Tax=Actinomadura sp. 3N407 TaxID=3457423 RepID=UPI003FCE594A
MKGLLGFLCFVLLAQGVGGLVQELAGTGPHLWGLTHKIGFLDDHQIYANIGLIVLGLAVGAAADSAGRREP